MTTHIPARTAARLIVDQLLIHGADTAYCVPGESYLPVLDALYESRDKLRLIVNRHESGAGFMAEAYGKLTGRPGLCFVTRGPGATNASIAVHTAMQDSTPLILFIGQVGSDCLDREAFQEIDYRAMFGSIAKWVAQIERADRIPEYIARAYQTATSGRMGPVVLALPEDLLSASAAVADARPYHASDAAPGADQLSALHARLARAQRPLVLLGGSGWTSKACQDIQAFAQANHLPVTCSFRRQDLFDNHLPNYVGDVGIGINPKLFARIRSADLVIAIGARLGEVTTSGYTLFDVPVPEQALVHIHSSEAELGRVVQPVLAINAGMARIAAALRNLDPIPDAPWRQSLAAARAEYEAWQSEPQWLVERKASLNLWRIVEELFAQVPRDALLANGAGNFATWGHRFHRYAGLAAGRRSQLAPTSGAMGYGVPAGIAAKIHDPDQTVIVIAGDGDFLMTGQELATAVREKAAVLFIIVNNGMYGTIRMHQEKHFPGRMHGTDLVNPDFVQLARAYGAFGERVTRNDEFTGALGQALSHIGQRQSPALIELITDPEVITPGATLAMLSKL